MSRLGKAKREREEACYICGHYHDYEGGIPCGVCGHRLQHTTEKGQLPSAYPSEILPGFLYLGSYDNASRCELLKAMDITHILNTVPDSSNLYKNSFTYDTVEQLPPDFAACNKFIDTAREAHTKVLVHCMSGITRSPAVVCAYLMHLRRWRLTESFKWVADKHPHMQLSPGDQQRLQEFELKCLGSSSVSFGGLQLPQAAGQPQAQPGSGLFSWNGGGGGSAVQQQQHRPPHAANGNGIGASSALQAALDAPGASAPFAGFNFTPGGAAGGFVFGVAPQQ